MSKVAKTQTEGSLIEKALELMKNKRSGKTIYKIAKEVFEIKGISSSEFAEYYPQFEMDFMLSGHFICCGEDQKTGDKIWDLKSRKASSLLDKDGNSLDDPYDDDEDVKLAELTDDTEYHIEDIYDDKNDDEDEDEEEPDDIAEELEAFAEIDDKIKCPHCNAMISPDVDICPICNCSIEEA